MADTALTDQRKDKDTQPEPDVVNTDAQEQEQVGQLDEQVIERECSTHSPDSSLTPRQ